MSLTIDSDAEKIAKLFNLASSQPDRAKIPKDKVAVCSLRLNLVSVANKFCRQCASICDDLLGILFE